MTFEPRSLEDLAVTWPRDLDHFSASSLKMAVRCPEQWRQRYVHGRRVPPSLSMLVGRADHAAIEHSMKPKIETGVDLPLGEVREKYVNVLETEVDNAGGLTELEQRDNLKKEYDKARTHGQDVVQAYHTTVSPHFQPLAMEKKFELHPADLPVRVTGYIDMVATDVNAFLPVMVDRKGSTRARWKPEPEWVIQAEIYQLAEPVPHEWHVSVATQSPRVILPAKDNQLRLDVVPKQRAHKMLEQVVAEIGFYYIKYGPDEPWPAKGKLHPWACGYCGYRPTCWGWAE